MKINSSHYATFGSGQLQGFNVANPCKVAVTKEGLTEDELRAELRKEPFNNNYCTTYPMDMFQAMADQWNVVMYDLDELRSLQ